MAENAETKKVQTFKREVGLFDITVVGTGATIGAPIFLITGRVIGMTGSAAVFVFILGGIIALLIGLSYSELATSWMTTGGGYAYVKEGFGGFWAYFAGLSMWFGNVALAALSALGFAYSIVSFLPFKIPVITIAFLIASIFIVINIFGAQGAVKTQVILTFVLSGTMLFLVVTGIFNLNMSYYMNFLPSGPVGVLFALSFVFSTYMGFNVIATMAEEIKTPHKTIPRAIILSVLATMGIYIALVTVVTGLLPYQTAAQTPTPLMDAARNAIGDFGYTILAIGGIIASLTSLNASIIASARIAYALGRDKNLPHVLSKLHYKYNSPWIAILFNGVVILLITVTGDIDRVTYLTSFGFLVSLGMVNLSVLASRKQRKKLERPFMVPLYPYTPIIAAAICFGMLLFLDPLAQLIGLLFLIFGMISYYLKVMGYNRIKVSMSGVSMAAAIVLIFTRVIFSSMFNSQYFPFEPILTLLIAVFVAIAIIVGIFLFIDNFPTAHLWNSLWLGEIILGLIIMFITALAFSKDIKAAESEIPLLFITIIFIFLSTIAIIMSCLTLGVAFFRAMQKNGNRQKPSIS